MPVTMRTSTKHTKANSAGFAKSARDWRHIPSPINNSR